MQNTIKTSCLFLLLVFAGCGKDNYDAPESTLHGKIVYEGKNIQVRGTDERVRVYLYQDGWQLKDPIHVFVTQDGAFTAKLFDGTYKLVSRDNNGPWVNTRDTSVIEVKGTTTVEMKVTPYFTVSGETISLSGTSLSASINITKVVADAQIERVYLVLSKTQFVDEAINIYRKDITDAVVGTNSFTADLSGNNDVSQAKYIYGRIGVKSNRTEEAVWSSVIKLK